MAGLVLEQTKLASVTSRFLEIKRKYFPGAMTGRHLLDDIRTEIKGAEVRKDVALGSNREKRHAIGFLDAVLALMTDVNARLFGRIWIKGVGTPIDGTSLYTSSMQAVCTTFQEMMASEGSDGIIIADSRNKAKNVSVSHSIFTQKFQRGGDPLSRLVEMPVFGHSDNHAGIQLADLLCSAFLFPIAVFTYCSGYVNNIHVRLGYGPLKIRYGTALQSLQFRYRELEGGKWRGGLTISDPIGKRSGGLLFK